MKPFKILVKDVDSFMINERTMFASGDNKRFFISLYAAPGVPRYTVQNMKSKAEKTFIKKGEAVKYFNELVVN